MILSYVFIVSGDLYSESVQRLHPLLRSAEDNQFHLMSQQLQHVLNRRYMRSMHKYNSDRPTTHNSFLNYWAAVRQDPQVPVCDRFADVEETFKSIRKVNPVECYTGRVYNQTRNMESLNDLVNVLAPHGNNTRRNMPGNCVFVLFYTLNCLSSRIVWLEYFNAHPFFPHIQWVQVDTLKFYTLNADFGITGLPTLMLFHQGKPVRKYNLVRPTAMRIIHFLWINTNLEPAEKILLYNEDNYYMPQPVYEPDPYLKLAWAFICICVLYYAVHTASFKKFGVFMKRMWHESARGQHGHND